MTSPPKLIVVGAGGFGREVFAWALDAERAAGRWRVGGFLDDDPRALEAANVALPILGPIATYQPEPDHRVVCAIGDPRRRLAICEDLRTRGALFASVIHPTAVLARGSRFGEGCILCPGAVVTVEAEIGDFVILNLHATVGHDVRIGDGCTLSAHVDVTGRAVLGKGVLLGSHASVLPGAVVGDFAVVGAGSVVLRRVPPGVTVMGVPARTVAGFGEAKEAP